MNSECEKKILILNDMPEQLDFMRTLLGDSGYQVLTANDGYEGLEVAKQENPDLVISDVMMPHVDGIEVCKRLRAEAGFRATPILLVSSVLKDTPSAIAGLEAGADDYVEAPFDPLRLIAKATQLIERKQAEKALRKAHDELALKVEERTAELSRANEVLKRQIAERESAEEALHQERIFLRTLIDNIPDLVYVKDTACRKVVANLADVRNLGLQSEAEILGKDDFALFPKEVAEEFFADDQVVLQTGQSMLNKEEYLIDAQGRKHWLLTNKIPLRNENGQVIGIVGIGRDITERKQAEEALRESEEKYRSLVANIPDVTWTSDSHGHSTFISPNVFKVCGYSAEEILRDSKGLWFRRIHPDDLVRVLQAYESLFSQNGTFNVEYRIQKKDGQWIWIHDKAMATYEKDGVRYADGMFSDITARKILESQLRQAQKLESIGQLAAGIAHEINTPTQYVSDNTRFLQDAFQDLSSAVEKYEQMREVIRSGQPAPQLIEEVEKAVEQADIPYLTAEIPKALQQSLEGIERITNIVRSMKDFAHPGASEKQLGDLNKAIESTITVARNEWKYVAEMEKDFDPWLPAVPCLLGEFNQVILNMIINAAHAIEDVVGDGSRGKGVIKISTRREGDWVEVRVHDTGTGIPEEIRPRIFDPFFTTKEVGKGTGQGLTISHTVIVEKHGGTMTFESEEGVGTTFIIRLPLNSMP